MMANTPADGWDHDERDALEGFERELDSLRARHAHDPEVELLRAAEADVLPDDLQSAGTKYLAASRWSRALVDGLNDPSVSLDQADQSRLFDRIRHEAAAAARPRPSWSWLWPSLAAAAAGIIAVVWVMRPGVTPEPTQTTTNRPVAVETPSPAPVYALAIEKPEVKLSPAALTWRSAGGQGDLTADLKSGLDAFRRDDYAGARRALADLTAKYPSSVEVLFYLGVSQLYLGETQNALDSFTKAAPLSDATFAADVAWYRAIADERLGHKDAARAALTSLCRGTSARGPAACVAAAAIK
jgi:tetratricopeptide (TPR) repeat protein